MPLSVEMLFNTLRIRFGDVTHLRIGNVANMVGFQSWREVYCRPPKYFIEYNFTSGAQIVSEYDEEAKWLAILAGLDETLGAAT